jgi:tetratricopeptide (TPR) repeat protein
MVEDITTALSRLRWLFVIARNSSFTYKGRAVDVKQVGRELGVRYVLEGSVRKAGSRMRITGQLIDTTTGTHLWADRFDGDLADVFELQDLVTSNVVGAIGPRLEQAEMERAQKKPTDSLDAHDLYLRGLAAFYSFSRAKNAEAIALFNRATELDPRFGAAYGMAARCYLQRRGFGWVIDREQEIAEARRLCAAAAEVGRDDAVALSAAGGALLVVVNDLAGAINLLDRSLVIDRNLAWTWHFKSLASAFNGKPEVAIEEAATSMRLSPQDPQMFAMQCATGFGLLFARRFEEASNWAETSLRNQPRFLVGACVAAATAAMADRMPEAERAMAKVRELNPTLRIANITDLVPIRRPEDFALWSEGLRRAGLPE